MSTKDWPNALKNGLGASKDIDADFDRLWVALPQDERDAIDKLWRSEAREGDQKPPEGDWLTWLMLGGRGAGKTRAGAEFVRGMAMGIWPFAEHGTGPIALVGETYADVREVMIEGASGILTVHPAGQRPLWIPSRRRLVWERTGVVAQAFSSEDPEALRGPQFAAAWSDGVGHTAAAGPPRPVAGHDHHAGTRPMRILARDLPRYEQRVAAALGDVPQTVFDGAVSFDFNTGAIHRASWVKAFRAGNRAGARDGLMLWTRAGGREVAGLVRRREAEARLIFEGDYGDDCGTDGAGASEVAAYQKPARGARLLSRRHRRHRRPGDARGGDRLPEKPSRSRRGRDRRSGDAGQPRPRRRGARPGRSPRSPEPSGRRWSPPPRRRPTRCSGPSALRRAALGRRRGLFLAVRYRRRIPPHLHPTKGD